MPTLNPQFNLKINDTDISVFMSYGLLQKLVCLAATDGEEFAVPIAGLTMHPEKAQAYFDELLKVRACAPGYGFEGPTDLDTLRVDPDEMEALLAWMSEHVVNFFVRRGENSQALLKRLETAMHTTNKPAESSISG